MENKKVLNIWYGTNDNAELSNLAYREFSYKGYRYYSVEHAYQTLKSGRFDSETYNRREWKNGGSKIVGKYKADRNTNIKLMETLVYESFKQNKIAAKQLIATGNAILTHKQDKGIWKTEFPRILMETRSKLMKNEKEKQ